MRHGKHRTFSAKGKGASAIAAVSLPLISFVGAGGRLLALQNPVARRNAQQIGNPPDHVVFDLAPLTVGINDIPEDAEQLDSVVFVDEVFSQIGREAVIIDRFAAGLVADFDQRLQAILAQVVAFAQQVTKLLLFLIGDIAIRLHDLETERDEGHPRIIGREFFRVMRAGQSVEEGLNAV